MIDYRRLKPLAALLLCAALAFNTAASAAEPAPYKPSAQLTDKGDPAQLAAIRRMLQALELPMAVRSGMATVPKSDRERYELATHMSQHATDADFCAVLAPSYVKYLSADQADRLAIHYRTSIGRRQVIAMLAREGVIKGEKNPFFTPSEVRELKAIDALPSSRALVKEQPQIQAANVAAMKAWSLEYYNHYLRLALSNLGEIAHAQMNYKTGDPGEHFIIRRTGLPTLDQYVLIVADSSIASTNASRTLQNDLRSYALEHLLDKDRLTTAAGIARSRQALADSGERIERYLHEMDLQQNAYRERITAASPDKQSLAAFEPSMLRQYETLVRFGENQRAQIDVLARVLDFAESRSGHIRAGDQGLLFENDDDLQLYRKLMAQVQALTEEEDRMNAERKARLEAALKGQVTQ